MAVSLPSSLRRLIKELASIPSIGPRQATRVAFYLASEERSLAEAISVGLYKLKDIKNCAQCFFIFEPEDKQETLCEICRNPKREADTVMIVEKPTDLISLENTGKFKGIYLILGDLPKTGVLEPWQKERLAALKKKVRKEVILALNPTSLGDFHASLITKELSDAAKKISRLGRGLPTGGEIEFADDETLGSALEGRD
jgi:recombination protein RecR